MTNKSREILSATAIAVAVVSAPVAASASQDAPRISTEIKVPRAAQDETGPVRQLDQRPPTQSIHRTPEAADAPRHEAIRTTTYRTTANVNVRERASTQSRRIGQLRAGQRIEVDRVSGNWLHVRNQGWISARYARRA